jgi:hypothetical protein
MKAIKSLITLLSLAAFLASAGLVQAQCCGGCCGGKAKPGETETPKKCCQDAAKEGKKCEKCAAKKDEKKDEKPCH